MRFTSLLFIVCFSLTRSFASDTTRVKIPLIRQHFHDRIDKEQLLIDRLDGKSDLMLRAGNNEEVRMHATGALFGQVDRMQNWVELNAAISSNNEKVRYLRYIENALIQFRTGCRAKQLKLAQLPVILDAFEQMLQDNEAGRSLLPYLSAAPYEIASLYAKVFDDNPGIREMRNIVYIKYCALYPDNILQTIGPYAEESFADSLIIECCKRDPVQFYSYAQSKQSPEGKLIHRSKDRLVMTVADMSQMPNALFYFPFLDDIMSGNKTIEQIYQYVGDGDVGYDSVGYYKMLVKTNIDYYTRMAPPLRDTPMAMLGPNGLREMLKAKAIQHFITPINDLHNEPNLATRMKAIEPLSAEEIYFVMVMGENDIYTSSYKHSFNRMLQVMGNPPRGDSLLQNVHFDQFRKFIKMAAGFNRLDTFLRTMPSSKSIVLMKAFVGNLDKSSNLEDAVDVADAYASITDRQLLKNILGYVQENEIRSKNEGNLRGEMIYGLLDTIFLSTDSSNRVDLTATLGLPSVYEIRPSDLRDDSGRIIQQVFFFGDDDGVKIFTPFINSFPAKEWNIQMKKEWVEIKSIKGKVWIFANRPLDYDASLDDSAQIHLAEYLEENELRPSVIVHRGHSYWLPKTIERMPANARLVVLGSCGGYKNLYQIIEICPEAHIISTKEIGSGEINRPLLNYLNQSFVSQKPIVWKQMWSTLSATFKRDPDKQLKEGWDSYIPPYKNLGAIFIQAYNKKKSSELGAED